MLHRQPLFPDRPFSLLERHRRPLTVLSAAFALLLLYCGTAGAAPVKDTATSGDWNTAGNWDPPGVPVAGDSVNVDLDMTVSASAQFGDNDGTPEPSLWADSNRTTITINSGQTLEHVAGSILQANGGSAAENFVRGPGTFLNSGTYRPENARFLLWTGNPVFRNSGLLEFTENGGRIEFSGGASFENAPGGTVRINLPNPNHEVRIFGAVDYTNNGNPFDFVQGKLNFAPPQGGTLDDAALENLIGSGPNPINSNSTFHIAGSYDAIDLSGSPGLDRVRLAGASESDSLVAATTGTTINVTAPGGIKTSENGRAVFNTASGSFDHQAGSTIDAVGNDFFLTGGGEFNNAGDIILGNTRMLFWKNGPHQFNNTGLVEFTTGGARLEFLQNGANFNNLPGGTVRVDLQSAGALLRIIGRAEQFINTGDPIDMVKGTVSYVPSDFGTLDDSALANLIGSGASPLNGDSKFQIGGTYDSIALTGSPGLDRVRLAGTVEADGLIAAAGGTTINVTAPGGIQTPETGRVVFNTGSGNTFDHVAGSKIVAAGQEFFFTGSGAFNNAGTIELGSTRMLFWKDGAHQFNNTGLLDIVGASGEMEFQQSGTAFNNLAGGTVRVNLPNGGNQFIVNGNGNPQTLSNDGTVTVTRGTLQIQSTVDVPQVSSTALSGGTWRVLADGSDATLDLATGGTSAGSITEIGSGASLTLSAENGGTAAFPQLGTLETIDGSVFVHGSVILPVDGGIDIGGTIGGSGQFDAVGSDNSVNMLSGSTLDPGGLNGETELLVINGDLSLNSDTNVNFTLDAGEQSDRIFVTGDLDLAGKFHFDVQGGSAGDKFNLFTYGNNLTIGSIELLGAKGLELDFSTPGEVNLLLVPEPTSMLAMMLPCAGLYCQRRRRRRR